MFLTPLALIAKPQPDLWAVAVPLVWDDAIYGHMEVPQGFITDLASIPRVFRNLPFLDPAGLSRRPAVLHDYLYGSVAGRRLGKAFADDFLHDALIAEGASRKTAWAFWAAVHYFGASSWAGDGAALAAPSRDPPPPRGGFA